MDHQLVWNWRGPPWTLSLWARPSKYNNSHLLRSLFHQVEQIKDLSLSTFFKTYIMVEYLWSNLLKYDAFLFPPHADFTKLSWNNNGLRSRLNERTVCSLSSWGKGWIKSPRDSSPSIKQVERCWSTRQSTTRNTKTWEWAHTQPDRSLTGSHNVNCYKHLHISHCSLYIHLPIILFMVSCGTCSVYSLHLSQGRQIKQLIQN